jgi:hypothetical protein
MTATNCVDKGGSNNHLLLPLYPQTLEQKKGVMQQDQASDHWIK